MADGRRWVEWEYTCTIAATLLNCRMGAKERVKPEDLHPMVQKNTQPMKVSIRDLRHVMMGTKSPPAPPSPGG